MAWTSFAGGRPGSTRSLHSTPIGWALERDLPVVLHVREAFEDTFAVLDQYTDTALRGVFHCFTGGRAEAEKVAGYGSFCFGLGGVTTFKNGGLDQVVPH